MNPSQTIKGQHRQLAGIATIVLAGALLTTPSAATAGQFTDGPVVPEFAAPPDIVEHVLYRKLQIAQDRVDRPWVYR